MECANAPMFNSTKASHASRTLAVPAIFTMVLFVLTIVGCSSRGGEVAQVEYPPGPIFFLSPDGMRLNAVLIIPGYTAYLGNKKEIDYIDNAFIYRCGDRFNLPRHPRNYISNDVKMDELRGFCVYAPGHAAQWCNWGIRVPGADPLSPVDITLEGAAETKDLLPEGWDSFFGQILTSDSFDIGGGRVFKGDMVGRVCGMAGRYTIQNKMKVEEREKILRWIKEAK